MFEKEDLTVQQKKQELLAYFLPFVTQDIYCSRLCDYLHKTPDSATIASMWDRWQAGKQNMHDNEKNQLTHIRDVASSVAAYDTTQAELLLEDL